MSQFGIQMHAKSDRKSAGNGKKLVSSRDKKRYEFGGYFAATRASEKTVLVHERGRGGLLKNKLKHVDVANVLTKNGYKKAKITGVLESKDNRNFARLAIITKGSVIQTELGKAIVTNRPGREGCVNAKLVEEVKA
ncbi:MAG: 30S ribosomal protein S8e [Candidatus Micrarchaeia archaeon]